jgi:hypothetical protein
MSWCRSAPRRASQVTRRKPFKLSRLAVPKGPGDPAQMRNPLIPELRWVRAELNKHADKLPPELWANLAGLISWAAWKLEHEPWSPQQIRYQRYCIVREGFQLAVRSGLRTARWKFALTTPWRNSRVRRPNADQK